jgi:hypothetical protein
MERIYLILMYVAVIILAIWGIVSGTMYCIRPASWARSRWSLYPPQFLEDLDRPVFRVQMRVVGVFLVIFTLRMLLPIIRDCLTIISRVLESVL